MYPIQVALVNPTLSLVPGCTTSAASPPHLCSLVQGTVRDQAIAALLKEANGSSVILTWINDAGCAEKPDQGTHYALIVHDMRAHKSYFYDPLPKAPLLTRALVVHGALFPEADWRMLRAGDKLLQTHGCDCGLFTLAVAARASTHVLSGGQLENFDWGMSIDPRSVGGLRYFFADLISRVACGRGLKEGEAPRTVCSYVWTDPRPHFEVILMAHSLSPPSPF